MWFVFQDACIHICFLFLTNIRRIAHDYIDEIEVFGKEKQAGDNDDDNVKIGDVNGDGAIDKFDYIAVKRAVMGTIKLTDAQQKAADVNGKDGVEKFDYVLIKRHVMGTYKIA